VAVLAAVVTSGVSVAPAAASAAAPTTVPNLVGALGWGDAGPVTATAGRGDRAPDVRVRMGRRLVLDHGPLRAALARAPLEGTRARGAPDVLGLPTPEGRVVRFAITESPVVEAALGRRHPETRTYSGIGIDDRAASVRLDLGPAGFHAQVRAPTGGWYIDPEVRGDATHHVAYRRADLLSAEGQWRELSPIPESADTPPARQAAASPAPLARTIGPQLRTYRLALATTGEYSTFHGGTVPLVHNALVAAVNRVNGIFRPELGVRLVLVANNDSLIHLDAATDPYTNDDVAALVDENQTRVDAVIGNAGYDIGHVFSTGAGGLAGLGVVGITGTKARGATGKALPFDDGFWVDYVAHELGHQLGGEHTFSGTAGNCAGNGDAPSAVEPGSGSSIMGYAGICGIDNLQQRTGPGGSTDPFFHAKSFDEIQAVLAKPGQGGVLSATGNATPTVTPAGGAAWTIPPRTPFVLSATATDANAADAVSLQWEQYDGGALRALTATPKTTGALFRSFPPTAGRSASRTFPRMASIVANTTNAVSGTCPALPAGLDCWAEFLPTAARTMKFRVTARDNRAAGGGVANAGSTVTVAGATPFRITSQNTTTSVNGGRSITVTWNVAGTNAAPYNVANVDIRLTTNNGLSFVPLATATPNDGSQVVAIPPIATTAARIQVRAVGNIFFDLNDADIAVRSAPISSGGQHSCALATGGGVKCWGDNSYGALGNPVVDIFDVAVPVTSISGATAVSVGGRHSCALLAAGGTVRCWGANTDGQLGNGTKTDSSVPVAVSGLTGVIALDAGSDFTCALLASGGIRCWGRNSAGQLGTGTTTGSSVPVPVLAAATPPTPLTGVIALSAGPTHVCAVPANRTLKCWGANASGQLGNGTTTGSRLPVPVTGLTGVIDVAAGSGTSCAVIANRTAKCWGSNSSGTFGNGTWLNDSTVPVPAAVGLTGIVRLDVAQYNACAVLADATARCWGFNGSGQLGNNLPCVPYSTPSNCDSLVPSKVSGLTGAVSVSIGAAYACAFLVGSTAKCWGLNTGGQLGNGQGGDGAYSLAPSPVVGIP